MGELPIDIIMFMKRKTVMSGVVSLMKIKINAPTSAMYQIKTRSSAM